MYMKAKLENINGMKADILEIIQQYKLGHIPEEQTIKELCDLFSFSKRHLIEEILDDVNSCHGEYASEKVQAYLDDGC